MADEVSLPTTPKVVIGCKYQRPRPQYMHRDQVWIQDVFTFNTLPAGALRFVWGRRLVWFSLYGSVVLVLQMLARYYA